MFSFAPPHTFLRQVQVDEFSDFPSFDPEGSLLCFRNQDKPGAIAPVLEVMEQHQFK